MKLYLVCQHQDVDGRVYHMHHAKAYGDTPEDAGFVYFMAVKEKYPAMISLNFCLQEATLDKENKHYLLDDEIFNADIPYAKSNTIIVTKCVTNE